MEEKKVSNSRLWVQKGGVLLGGCGITGTYSLYNSLASIFYTDVLGISATAMGVMVFISKVWDAINDIMCGALIDRTNTRWGKGRPYELCIIGQTICTVLLFAGNPAWSNVVKCVWIFCMYSLTFSLFATFRNAALNP